MNNLLTALNSVTEDDFNAMEKEIEEKRNELASLESLIKVIAVKLGKVTPKVARGKSANFNASNPDEEQAPPGTTQTEFRRKRIKEYLMANGPMPQAKIVKGTGIPQGSITAVLKHPMFVQTALGYGLAENHR